LISLFATVDRKCKTLANNLTNSIFQKCTAYLLYIGTNNRKTLKYVCTLVGYNIDNFLTTKFYVDFKKHSKMA